MSGSRASLKQIKNVLQNVHIVKHMHNIPLVAMLLLIDYIASVQLFLSVVARILVASHYKGRTSDVAAKMPWK